MTRNKNPREPAKLAVGGGGWVQVVGLDNFVAAFVRFHQRDDGRLRPNALLLDTAYESDLDVQTMRSFPLLAVETMANLPEYHDEIERQLGVTTTVSIEADGSPNRYRSVAGRRRGPIALVSLRLKLPKPDHRGRYPDRFYEYIAALYRSLVEREGDRAPAQTIANANDVPVTTVHRWIREARRRNLLAPASAQGVRG